MKVLLVNGSPHKEGCTYRALMEVGSELQKQGIETEVFQLGTKPVYGCVSCGACKDGRGSCALDGDVCNALIARAAEADGFVFGTPVYYAGPNGALCAVMDRAFYSGRKYFAHKPVAAVVNCRRGGASAAFDRMNKYFSTCCMPIITSQYWNSTHGYMPEQVEQDLEGLQTMRTLGQQMAWWLNAKKEAGLPPLAPEQIRTNFIR